MSIPHISCEIAFVTNPGVAAPIKYSVNEWMLEFNPDRGRDSEFSLFDAGTMKLVLDNADRRFEPGYAGSPYYPFVIPMRQVFLSAIWPLNVVRPVDNSGFERGDFGTARPWGKGWTTTVVGPAVWSVAASTLQGAFAARITQPSGATGGGQIASDLTPCQSGAVFSCHFQVKNSSGSGTATASVFGWRAYNAKRTLMQTGYLNDLGAVGVAAGITYPTNGGNGFTIPNDGVLRTYGGSFSVPKDATYIQLFVTPYANTTVARDMRVDAFSLRPGLDVTLYELATESDIFTGFVAPKAWPIGWSHRHSEITADCVDGMAAINRKKLYKYFASDTTDKVLGKMLDEAKWPTGTLWRQIDPGRALLQEQTIEGEEAGSHLQQAADSELGLAFLTAGSKFRFVNRENRRLTKSVATVSDKPVAGEYTGLDMVPNTWPIYNDVQVLPVNGETPFTQQAADAAAQQAKTLVPQTLERQPLVAVGAEAQGQADWLYNRYKQDRGLRIEQLALDPTRDDAMWPFVLRQAEIANRITIKKTAIPGKKPTDGPLVFDGYIERVRHFGVARDRRTWRVELVLSPAIIDVYGVLDSTTLGKLDSTMVLGF